MRAFESGNDSVFPGGAFSAIKAGADILKCFPCGTAESISILKSVIPLPIIAVGGINKENKNQYLKTSDGLGVGVGIFSPDMTIEELKISSNFFFKYK